MRTALHALVGSLLLSALAGCATPRQAAPVTRATPAGTVESFKYFARQQDAEGEWDILSPEFKRRINQQAGRNVDVGDYAQMRAEYRADPQVREAEKWLQTVIVTRVEPAGPGSVYATVVTGGGPLAQKARIHMVQLTRWQLYLQGQDEPYQGFTNDPNFRVERRPDGGYDLVTINGRQAFPASQVRDYKEEALWYVDDLGGMEGQFFR